MSGEGEMMMKVYGAMHNPCTHESASGIISLHITKRGAWRTAWLARWNKEVEGRERDLRHGKWTSGRRYVEDWKWWGVQVFEVEQL